VLTGLILPLLSAFFITCLYSVLNNLYSGLRLKLKTLAKKKDCDKVGRWIQSIVNHLYWIASRGIDSTPEQQQAMWASIVNHVVNIHTHKNPDYPKCAHPAGLQREWLCPGT
jgi:hypothetical protein